MPDASIEGEFPPARVSIDEFEAGWQYTPSSFEKDEFTLPSGEINRAAYATVTELQVSDNDSVFEFRLDWRDAPVKPGTSDIKDRLAYEYGKGGSNRRLHSSIHVDANGKLGSAHFSLAGTPPKGYAIVNLDSNGTVWFYNNSGRPVALWRNTGHFNLTPK